MGHQTVFAGSLEFVIWQVGSPATTNNYNLVSQEQIVMWTSNSIEIITIMQATHLTHFLRRW